MGEHERITCILICYWMMNKATNVGIGGKISEWDGFVLECHRIITPQRTPRAQRKSKIKTHHGGTETRRKTGENQLHCGGAETNLISMKNLSKNEEIWH